MKLLINLCSHDGIISHYNGVGTMTKRYLKTIISYLEKNNIEYNINLITPEYKDTSFGYSSETKKENEKLKHVQIIQIDNGSNAAINYGYPINWKTLTKNAADFINGIDKSIYDKVITIYNDTTLACLSNLLKKEDNHIKIWIPHSTIKIHEVDSAVKDSDSFYQERLKWEQDAINYANEDKNSYIGIIGEFIKKHLIEEYSLRKDKCLKVFNGELLNEDIHVSYNSMNEKLFKELENNDSLILSFGRAEIYKNLIATINLGKEMKMRTVVIAQSYFKEQPILKEYKDCIDNNQYINLYIDPPFNFAKYILQNFNKPIIVVIPSKKEIMGLIINEIRKFNKENVLIVSNDVDGLNEQINDGIDGIVVDIDNSIESKEKILNYLEPGIMKKMNDETQKTLKSKYDLHKNIKEFLDTILEEC